MAHEIRLERRREGTHETLTVQLTDGETLMEAARLAGLPIAAACGGSSLCARCGLRILAGRGHLSPQSETEREVMERNRIDPALRLACQAIPSGPVAATATYW